MWQRTVLYIGLGAAFFSAMPFEAADSAPASAMTARSADHAVSPYASHRDGIQRSNDGLFYIDAQLGSGKARLLVDTGASHVTLSHADAKKAISRPARDRGPKIVTAAGAIDVDWVIIEKLDLHGNVLTNVRAAIPRRDTGLSLLGQSALVHFSSIRIDGDRLSLIQ